MLMITTGKERFSVTACSVGRTQLGRAPDATETGGSNRQMGQTNASPRLPFSSFRLLNLFRISDFGFHEFRGWFMSAALCMRLQFQQAGSHLCGGFETLV